MGLYSVRTDAKKQYLKQEGGAKISATKQQNILKQRFNVTEPNQFWVGDIACFKTNGKCFYICMIIDLFSRKVISHVTSLKSSTYLVTSIFRKALEARGRTQQLTFHSDQGCQYTSKTFQKLLRVNKVVQSFSGSGRPCDNAVAEAFFASLKKEELYRTNYKSESEFRKAVDSYIRFYNEERPHTTLNFKTPERYEAEFFDKTRLA